MPSTSEIGFHHLQKVAIKAFRISLSEDRGPVHLNFPFRKPIEPFSYTDVVKKRIYRLNTQRYNNLKTNSDSNVINFSKASGRMIDELIKSDKGIIIAGPMEYDRDLIKGIKILSAQLKYPVFADGLSQLRFNARKKDKNIISNYNSILKSEIFILEHNPEIILQIRENTDFFCA